MFYCYFNKMSNLLNFHRNVKCMFSFRLSFLTLSPFPPLFSPSPSLSIYFTLSFSLFLSPSLPLSLSPSLPLSLSPSHFLSLSQSILANTHNLIFFAKNFLDNSPPSTFFPSSYFPIFSLSPKDKKEQSKSRNTCFQMLLSSCCCCCQK